MSSTLYRKYRPKLWSEVIGQNHIKITLQNEILTGNITHAYLFTGPRGVGKTTVARLFAKSINCIGRKDSAEPCEACASCTAIQRGGTFDIIEIDAASHTGVDNVRENIITNTRIVPSQLKYKVFIIDEVHMLSNSAFNALLKTLEEPPAHVIFLLATTEVHKVPDTIISRCQRFDFRRVETKYLLESLTRTLQNEGVHVDSDVLELIAARAQGGIRDAQSLLGQILALNEKNITMEMAKLVIPKSNRDSVIKIFQALLRKDAGNALETVEALIEDGAHMITLTQDLIGLMRDVMLTKARATTSSLQSDEQTLLVDDIKNTSLLTITRMIDVLMARLENMKQSDMPELPLEIAMIEIVEEVFEKPERRSTTELNTKKSGGIPKNSDALLETALGGSRNTSQVAEKKTEIETASSVSGEKQGIQAVWGKILKEMRKYNHALHLTLKVAEVLDVKEGKIVLGFRYKFYKDRILEAGHKETIEKVVNDIYGKKLFVVCEVDEKFGLAETNIKVQAVPASTLRTEENIAPVTEEEASNVWDLALNTFGAESQK